MTHLGPVCLPFGQGIHFVEREGVQIKQAPEGDQGAWIEQLQPGEPLACHLGTIIGGCIIEHPVLKWRSCRICQDGGKTIF